VRALPGRAPGRAGAAGTDGAPRSGRSAPEAELRFGYLLGVELARLLINLAPTPRAFRYAAVDRFQLARRGLGVPRSDYKVVELPPDVPIELIEIPALEPDAVHALAFWASVVPHVGLDGPDGHFLASYEAVRKRLPEAA